MKISSASKKVLASALSAAMVVAFAPTVAFAAADDSTSAGPTIPDGGAYVEGSAVIPGTVAHYVDTYNGKLITVCFGADGSDAAAAVNKALTSEKTVILDQDVTGVLTSKKKASLDLNGHTVKTEDAEATINTAGGLTVKNGTISAEKKGSVAINDTAAGNSGVQDSIELTDVNVSGKAAAVSGNDKLTIKNGTYGAITATSVAVKGAVSTDAIAGDVSLDKKAALTVATENTVAHATDDTCTPSHADAIAVAAANKATGIKGDVKMGEESAVTVTATSKAGFATGIEGNVTADKKATVSATAKAIANGQDAYGIKGEVAADSEGAAVNASAVSAAAAYGIAGKAVVKTGTVSAEGANDASSWAVSNSVTGNSIAGGTFTGKVKLGAGAQITGGKFSANPEEYVDTASYDVSKADGVYTVQKFTGFAISGKGSYNADIVNYVKAATEEMVKGNTPAGIKLAEGVTAADFVAQAAKGVNVNVKVADYNEKNATDEQKAAKKAIDDLLKVDLYKLNTKDLYKTVTITLEYDKTGQVEPVVLGTVTELGQIQSGMSTKQAVLEVSAANDAHKTQSVYSVTGGKAAKTAWKKDVDGQDTDKVEFTAVPTLYTYAVIDTDAVKDAAQAGKDASETITDPAVLAAIKQLQDENAVLQVKGKTVKAKAKKKTTAKLTVVTSASGNVSTFAKTSGNAKIKIAKGGKITVAKGLKAGKTYKAKVKASVGAATKTVTVTVKVAK